MAIPKVPKLLVLAALLAWGLAYVGLADGGANEADLGAFRHDPDIQAWQLTGEAGVLCSHSEPCAPSQGGKTCTWEGVVWLSSANNPAVLRRVEATGWAVGWVGNGSTATGFEGPADVQGGGYWLRALAEHVTVAAQLPCDAQHLEVSINVQARTLFGRQWHGSQSIELQLR